jgi:hypothetical protein
MSFAVSAVIAPSRRLRCLLAVFCASLVTAAVVVGFGTPERFAFDGLVAFAPLAGALALVWSLIRSWCPSQARPTTAQQVDSQVLLHRFGTPRRIDVVGLGQVRLTVQREMRVDRQSAAPSLASSSIHIGSEEGVLVTVLPGAIVWPYCMVLRLRSAEDAIASLVLLPDSMGKRQFRALAVAVRALANGTTDTNLTQNTLNLLQETNS